MKKEAMQKHPEEWFFLHNFDVDRVFSTIRRADYLVLFYIKMRQESHPDEKLYLADLAAEMGVKVTELSKGIEKLQDQGYVRWLTDREAGRTYVELTSKAVELMAEERDLMKRCYARLRTELGDEELRRTVDTLQHMRDILKDERERGAEAPLQNTAPKKAPLPGVEAGPLCVWGQISCCWKRTGSRSCWRASCSWQRC